MADPPASRAGCVMDPSLASSGAMALVLEKSCAMCIATQGGLNMRKKLVATMALPAIALFVTACPPAYAQAPTTPAPQVSGAEDADSLTDVRINVVKAALQLTP